MMLLKLPFSFSCCVPKKNQRRVLSQSPGLNVNDSHAQIQLWYISSFSDDEPRPLLSLQACKAAPMLFESLPRDDILPIICSSIGARDLGCALLRGAASSAWRVMLERDYPGVEAAPGCSVAALKPLLLAERRRQAAAAAAAAERLRLSPVRQRCWA
jgi:hypothetical protein